MAHTHEASAVLVEGDGIAAVCTARLLTDAGVRCVWRPNARPKLAAILLGEQTQSLLRELFPATDHCPGDILKDFLQVRRRVVLWGESSQPLDLPHSGVVAPEGELLQRLWERVPALELDDTPAGAVTGWQVQTTRTAMDELPEREFGNRRASVALAALQPHAIGDACWVESVKDGWLFLLARDDAAATLIAVGGAPEALLAQSLLVARQIADVVPGGASITAHPRLTETLADGRQIACGSAAMSFDPLCGEGAGNAVRQAFLAAAVIRASLQGHSPQELAAHYNSRLRRGFLRHLQLCLQFYSSGGQGDFWTGAAAPLAAGIQELVGLVQQEPATLFRLMDRDLQPVQAG